MFRISTCGSPSPPTYATLHGIVFHLPDFQPPFRISHQPLSKSFPPSSEPCTRACAKNRNSIREAWKMAYSIFWAKTHQQSFEDFGDASLKSADPISVAQPVRMYVMLCYDLSLQILKKAWPSKLVYCTRTNRLLTSVTHSHAWNEGHYWYIYEYLSFLDARPNKPLIVLNTVQSMGNPPSGIIKRLSLDLVNGTKGVS
ncbi:hypothetical protein ACJQWK_04612 [Exserohilum turcicum]